MFSYIKNNFIVNNGVLDLGQLERIKQHKYSHINNSLIEPHLEKWWQYVLHKYPMWLAPNLITVTGLLVNIAASLLLFIYSPDAHQSFPVHISLIVAVTIFIYQTLDGTDGKQARRTQSASPLGELFDHGCDSLSTVFVALGTAVTCCLGMNPWYMLASCLAATVLFYASHWQTYMTGTFYLSKIDAAEAQYFAISAHLITFFAGQNVWKILLFGVPLNLIITSCVLLGLCSSLLVNLRWMLQQESWKQKLTPVLPLAVTVATITWIANKSSIYLDNPCLFILTVGIIMSKLTNKLVVSHMTKSPMDCCDSVMVWPALLLLYQQFGDSCYEYQALIACLLLVSWDLTTYCYRVCTQIADTLQIQVFRIKYDKQM